MAAQGHPYHILPPLYIRNLHGSSLRLPVGEALLLLRLVEVLDVLVAPVLIAVPVWVEPLESSLVKVTGCSNTKPATFDTPPI